MLQPRHGLAQQLLGAEELTEELSRLPESVLVPLPELGERAGEIRPREGQQVVCYCHHGVRSLHAAEYLGRLGLPDVVSLAGGIDAWSLQIDSSVPRY